MVFKEITKNVSITVKNNFIFVHLKKFKPVIIDSNDIIPKGVEIRVCAKCKLVGSTVLYCGKRNYCETCSTIMLTSKQKPKE